MWQVTRDTWHVTCDMFGEVNILSKFQLPSSYRLWLMILWRSGGKGWLAEWMNESMNESMNYEAVYRTAPATPGLLTRRTAAILSRHYLMSGQTSGMGGWHPGQGRDCDISRRGGWRLSGGAPRLGDITGAGARDGPRYSGGAAQGEALTGARGECYSPRSSKTKK